MELEIVGGSAPSALVSDINNSVDTMTLTVVTGWPDGSDAPFGIVINLGESDEEVCVVTARTAAALSGVDRGEDGTSAVSHSAGATVHHIVPAFALQEMNDVSNDVDLVAIMGLSPSNDDFLQRKAGAWTNRTKAQVVTDLSSALQPLDADLTAIAALSPTNDDVLQRKAGAWVNRTPAQLVTDLALGGTYQPVDSDLTAIAALTTTAYGRALLTAANLGDLSALGLATDAEVAAGYQPLDADLTAIAALTTTATGRALLEVATAAAARAAIEVIRGTVGASALSSPAVGDHHFDTDDSIERTYLSATTGFALPWGLPWGIIGRVTRETNAAVAFASGVTDVGGMSITFTAVKNRRYRFSASAPGAGSASPFVALMYIRIGSTVKATSLFADGDSDNVIDPWRDQFCQTFYEPSSTASTTVKLSIECGTNPGTYTLLGDATAPIILFVEDMGPTGNPA